MTQQTVGKLATSFEIARTTTSVTITNTGTAVVFAVLAASLILPTENDLKVLPGASIDVDASEGLQILSLASDIDGMTVDVSENTDARKKPCAQAPLDILRNLNGIISVNCMSEEVEYTLTQEQAQNGFLIVAAPAPVETVNFIVKYPAVSGFPTSPIISNYTAQPFDLDVSALGLGGTDVITIPASYSSQYGLVSEIGIIDAFELMGLARV